MATSMVDLSSLQTVNFGGGVTGSYDPNSGTYYDSGGNPLSASDLAQYGAFSVSSSGSVPPPPNNPSAPPPVNPSGSGASLAGITGLFGGLGNAIVNAARPSTVTTPQGTLVYNPSTGQYTSAQAVNTSAALNPLILLVLGGVVIFLVVRSTRRAG